MSENNHDNLLLSWLLFNLFWWCINLECFRDKKPCFFTLCAVMIKRWINCLCFSILLKSGRKGVMNLWLSGITSWYSRRTQHCRHTFAEIILLSNGNPSSPAVSWSFWRSTRFGRRHQPATEWHLRANLCRLSYCHNPAQIRIHLDLWGLAALLFAWFPELLPAHFLQHISELHLFSWVVLQRKWTT